MFKQIFDFCILSFLIAGATSIKLGSSTAMTTPDTENLIQNGDFELPAFAAGRSWQIFTSTSGSGWTLRDNEIEIGIGTIYNRYWTSGRVCELDGNKNDKISQTVTLDAIDYYVEFDIAARLGVAKGSNLLNTYFNNVLLFAFSPIDDFISHQKFKVRAIQGSNTIAFEGAGTSDSLGATIDNVKLYKVSDC